MLRSFRVENHKSIKGEAELVLVPAYDKSRPAVLVAGVFGANASGKSNLLDALRWMQESVRTSFAVWEPGLGVPRHPFRLDPVRREEPSTFTVDVSINDIRHTYGFVVNSTQVLEEWFFTYPRGKKRVIFERELSDWRFGSTVSGRQNSVLEELTRDNALFLSLASRVKLAEAMPMYLWFQHSLAFVLPGQPTLDPEQLDDWLGGSLKRRRQATALLRAADLGITDFRVEEVMAEPETPRLQVSRPELSFLHGSRGIALGIQDQSHGTRAWLGLLIAALKALENGTTLLVDEVDSSLHPRLTARLVELFKSPETNASQAQLIFTTHDATLLGSSFGQDILARDEIWFVDKGRDGATTLYPLTDFHPRKEESTQRRYLGGSYGAVPNVSEYEFRRAVLDDSEVA